MESILVSDILNKEKLFIEETGDFPKFLIINSAEAQVLSYDICLLNGMEEDDALLSSINKWRGMYICRIDDPNFNEIYLK